MAFYYYQETAFLIEIGLTGWVGIGFFRVWCMETLGENAEAYFKSIFIQNIPSSMSP